LVNQRANFQLTAITLGLILLGGTILGSAPFAFAEHDDDDKKAKLKDLLEEFKAKIKVKKPGCDEPPCGGGGGNEDKCKGTKYGEICDDQGPSVGIKVPGNGDKLPAGEITVVIKAKDIQTGVKKVEVFINNVLFGEAVFVGGELYELDVVLNDPGRYKLQAVATDNAGLTGSDKVNFRII